MLDHPLGDRLADAFRGAGDDGDLAGEVEKLWLGGAGLGVGGSRHGRSPGSQNACLIGRAPCPTAFRAVKAEGVAPGPRFAVLRRPCPTTPESRPRERRAFASGRASCATSGTSLRRAATLSSASSSAAGSLASRS